MEKKKLHFNFIDAAIIIIVIAAAFLGWKLYAGATENEESVLVQTHPMSYVVRCTALEPVSEELLKVGETIYDSRDGSRLGTISDVATENYYYYAYDKATEQYRRYEKDTCINIYVTIEAEGFETDDAITIGGVELRVGEKSYIKVKGLTTAGYIVEINTDIEN